ncbi:MAG: cobalamin B12-binding domain-containing protein [Xanthomonadales bacterium]|nr:cobalamin B12-binding domain-containing protein [Xanthomonadales bacterium]
MTKRRRHAGMGHAGHKSKSDRRMEDLKQRIEAGVLPRLMYAHSTELRVQESSSAEKGPVTVMGNVAEFTERLLDGEEAGLIAYVDELLKSGIPLEKVFLDLLAPVARRLGEMWVADICSFTDVTIGVLRLQRILHRYLPQFVQRPTHVNSGQRVLIAALPGEQHTFGKLMVAGFFRRAGWHVDDGPFASNSDLLSVVRRKWFVAVGISLSCESRIEELAGLISAVRDDSRNRGIGVMVGGWLFNVRPELIREVGADMGGEDALKSARDAQTLFGGPDSTA